MQVHPNPVVYYIYLLVFWLHSQCHLPFRVCKAILVTFTVILNVCGVGRLELKTTLPGVMHALNAEPSFRVCPVYPRCQKVFGPATESTAQCCNEPLFDLKPTAADQRQGRDQRQNEKPRLQFPYKLLEEQLATMLAVPGIETEIEKSRVKLRSTTPGEYNNIFNGRVCHTLPCKDGSLFFDPSDEVCDSGELRIGLALGVDWLETLIDISQTKVLMTIYLHRFSYLRSQIAPSHTSCPMSFSVVNLPPHLQYVPYNAVFIPYSLRIGIELPTCFSVASCLDLRKRTTTRSIITCESS